jgi:hypothetical protein
LGFFGAKILKFFDADPGYRIRDGDNSDPGSGTLWETIIVCK